MTIVTPDNHGPLVNVAMWMGLAPMIIVTGVKIYTKWESMGKVQRDDFFMFISMVNLPQNFPNSNLTFDSY